jgi:PAS domain S-box-containing protein
MAEPRLAGPSSELDAFRSDSHDWAGYRALLDRYQRLRNADATLRDVLDSVLIGVWDYDVASGRTVRSMTHDQIFGYSEALQQWTFDTLLDHVAPEHRARIRHRFEACLTSGAGEFDCRIIRADGSPAWIWWRARVVPDANGTPVRVVGIIMDVTRQTAEQALGAEATAGLFR